MATNSKLVQVFSFLTLITNNIQTILQAICLYIYLCPYSQTEWFGTDNVMIQDVFTVSTDNGAQLEVQFYVSLPDIPLNSNATTNYVVPGGVLLELLGNRVDLLPSPFSLQCTNSLNQLLPYLLVTFVLGVLFALALFILAFIICKLYKCWNEKAHIIVSRK